MARKQSAPRLEFEAAAIYEYPEHLRPWLEALPKLPGVYQVSRRHDTMPLYIGKRQPPQPGVIPPAHPEEAAMLRQSRRHWHAPLASWERCCWRRG